MTDRQSPIDIKLDHIKDGVDGINARLDALNGRTRKVEIATAVHSWAIGLGGALGLAVVVWVLSKI